MHCNLQSEIVVSNFKLKVVKIPVKNFKNSKCNISTKCHSFCILGGKIRKAIILIFSPMSNFKKIKWNINVEMRIIQQTTLSDCICEVVCI